MERRISEVKDQYQKLKRECEVTVDLLNNLLKTCSTHVESLNRINIDEHRLYLKYFLSISQYQLAAHQKILEHNIELEEYLLVNQVKDIVQTKESTSSMCILSSPDFKDELNLKDQSHDLQFLDNNVTIQHCLNKDVDGEDAVDLMNNSNTTSVLDDSSTTTTEEVFYDLEDPYEFNNIDKKRVSSEVSLQSSKQTIAGSGISTILKNLSIETLEERYLKSLLKTPMPDISLKPSDKKSFKVNRGIHSIKSDKKKKKDTKEFCFNKIPVVYSMVNNEEFAVFEIGHRETPLVGDICMIGYVESPSSFYIQVTDESSSLIDVISEQLAEINNNTSLLCSTKLEASNYLGKFCSLAIEGIWYRAEILDWLEDSDSDQVCVQLIDYGNPYSVMYKSLRPLPSFCHCQRLAQKCHLAYLYPPGSVKTKIVNRWPAASKDGFLNYCDDINHTLFKITYVYPTANSINAYEIDLVRWGEDVDEKSIGELLLESELAVQIIDDIEGLVKHNGMFNQILAAHGCGGVTSSMTQDEVFNIYFNEIEEEPGNINEAVMKYNPRDEAETCRNLRPDGTCYKGKLCKFRHSVLKSGFTNDKEAVFFKTFADVVLPQAGDEVMLTITHIVDIQCFYAQIRGNSNGISSSINDLINSMNEPQSIKKYKKLNQIPAAGEIVMAPYWNNYWYRGQVRDVSSSDLKVAEVEVYFVDFGDILTMPTKNLRCIIPDYLQLPFQAIECRISNLKHKAGSDENREIQHFASNLLGVTLKAQIVAVPGHLQVLLQTSSGQDVALQMIEAGFGELNTEHNFPNENELILVD